MKKNLLFLFILCIITLLSCNNHATESNNASADTLYSYKNIVRIHMENPQLALARTDTAEMKHILPVDTCNLLRIIIYGSMNDNDKADKIALDYLDSHKQEKHEPLYLWILQGLTDNYMTEGKNEETLKYCMDGIKLARECKDLHAEADFLFSAGSCMIKLNNERGYSYIDSAISTLEEKGTPKDIPAISAYYGQKSRLLANNGKYDKAAESCKSRLKVIERLKEIKEKIPDGYIDEQKGRTLSVLAYCLAKAGKQAEADATAKEFYNTAFSGTPNGYDDIQYYELEAKHGQKLLDICNRLHPLHLRKDTFNVYYASHLNNIAESYRLLGRYPEAYNMMVRMDVVKDTIFDRERDVKALEMSEKFHTQEKEIALLKEQAKLRKSRIVTIILAIILVSIVIMSVIIYRHYHKIRLKNRILVKQINELMDYQKEMRQIKKKQTTRKTDYTMPEHAAIESQPEEQKFNLGLSILYEKMENLMQEQQIYKDVNLNRETIMQMLNINRNQLAQMMSENAEGQSINNYINNYRVQNACDMIRQNPDMSMQMICTECGFNSIRTFNRLFKQQLSLTPQEYKAALC